MRLAAESAWGDVPVAVGSLRLREVELGAVTEVLPLAGKDVSAALEQAVGVGFPGPGTSNSTGNIRVLWAGREAALVIGARLELDGAVCVDQSDGWAALELQGAVRSVLARLCPLDLREGQFPTGATARSLLNQVTVSLTRIGDECWLLLVPRSMTGTVLDEIVTTAESVAARQE